MVTTRIKGSQIFDGTIKSEDIDDTLEKEFTKVRVTTGDAAPDFLHLKIATSGSIIANVIGISGSAQLLALSGTAAGVDTQVQFNDGGSFAGSTGLTYSKASSTLFGVTGSFTDNFSIGGSLNVTKDISLTGSNIFLANPLSIDNNTLYIDSTNNRVGIGKIPSVTFDVSGSTSSIGADNPSIIFNGDTFISGAFGVSDYIQFKPVGTTRIPTNTTASYIYTSGSTNDLYFTQYSGEFTNTTRLRWLESTLATGLLHGGVITATPGGTTFNISAGEGLIITQNATTASAPFPTIQLVKWNDQTNIPLTYSGSAKLTYVGIDNLGAPIQQTAPWGTLNISEWDNSINLGVVLHLSGAVVGGVFNSPNVSYAPQQRQDDFFRAFGPLKISGHILQASGSTLSLKKTGGTAYKEGANYTTDPNHPSTVVETNDITVSKIYRYHISGSTPVIDTGVANAGYSVIDPTQYVNTSTGQLATMPNNEWSIQRVFWVPNSPTNAFLVYYGSNHYQYLVDAENAILTETFTEAPNTAQNAIQVASIVVRQDCTSLADSTRAIIKQSGLFRQVGGVGGSGQATIPTVLGQLGDVSLSGLTNKDLLVYNNTTGYWNNSKTIDTLSASVITSNFSGSLTKLSDGTSYLVAGSGISISTGSGGSITITNDGTVGDITSVTAGTGLTGGGTSGAVTLAINDSIVATVSGTQFKGAVGVTGSLGASSLSIAGGLLYQLSGVIQQNGNLTWDATNNRLGIGVTNPARQLQVLSGFRFGDNTDYYELLTAGSGIIRWTPGGAITTLEINNPVLFPPAKTLGFTPSLGSLTIDSGFSRAAAGIINVSGSAPGALFRFNATSTPLAVGDLGMNVSSGRPVMYTTGSVHQAAHIDEVALLTGATFTGAVKFNAGLSGSLTKLTDGTSYLLAGSGISITTGSSGAITITNDGTVGDITSVTAGTGLTGGGTSGDVTLAINDSIVATVSGTSFTGNVNVNSGNLNIVSGSTFNLIQSASTLNIGTTSGIVRTINIGNNSHANTAVNIDAGNTINIGNNASPSGTRTINIGTGNQPTFMTLGQNNNNSVTTIYGGSNGITLATANSGPVSIGIQSVAGNISVATGTATQTVNIASGSGVKTTYLGSPHTSSTTYLYAGTGGIFVSGSTVTFQQGLTSVGNILPSADVTYSLGSATQRWQHIYTGDLHLKNERGDWTIIEEETYLTIRNNKTGKRYKINMEPLPELDEELGKFSTGPTK